MNRYNALISSLLCVLFLFSCREEEEVITVSPAINLSGYIQKGPFINGTTLLITELDDSLAATGKTFTTQIKDNRGSFSIKTSQLDYYNLQLIATGFYFDEVKGEKSAAQLTLFALADVSEANQINVNVLSHLEKERIMYLISQGKSFTEAKKQAQGEILMIFSIEKEDIANSETLDISQQGEDNAILLAISAILQGNNTVAELSELLADITSDIREDGTLDSESLKEELKNNAISLNLSNIRQYVQKRYAELGVGASIPDFEKYIDSDGDGILNKEEDDIPDEFVFEAQENIAINTEIMSNEITIAGISEDGFITAIIQNGTIIKNGETLQDTILNLVNGDKIKVQLTSSQDYSTSTTASLKIGSLEKQFTVTTDDYTPDEFSFTNIESAMKDTDYTTPAVTITGIKYPTSVTIDGGIIIKNGNEMSEDSITVVSGDKLAIKVHSHPEWAANTVKVQLKVGSVTKEFQIINKINRWIRKASFPGSNGYGQAGFAIQDKLYVLTSASSPNSKEFYEYDPATNKWTKRANFPGAARKLAVSFVLNGKGYIGLGIDYSFNSYYKDFWEYDPKTNTWAKMPDLPGPSRWGASCFVINNKAYVGLGYSYNNSDLSDLWEYNPTDKQWTSKAKFPAEKRYGAIGFSVDNAGYFAAGFSSSSGYKKDVWQYNPETNNWIRKRDFPGGNNASGMSFTINNKVYFGMGDNRSTGNDNFWEYYSLTDTWQFLDGFNSNVYPLGLSISGKGYYILGAEVYEYTP